MADEPSGEIVIRDEEGTEHVFPAGFDPQRAASIVRASRPPKTPTKAGPSTSEQVGRGATATLPYIGGTLGAMAGSIASPIIGTAAGAGGGAALGEGFRQLANQYFFGDKPDPVRQMTTGAGAAFSTGALAALPAGLAALRPASIMADIERKGTISPGVLGAEAIKRAATALRPTPGPILQRPTWQAAEGPPPPLPVSDEERAIAGTLGRHGAQLQTTSLKNLEPTRDLYATWKTPSTAPTEFHEQPLYQQLQELETQAQGPLAEGTRTAMPPYAPYRPAVEPYKPNVSAYPEGAMHGEPITIERFAESAGHVKGPAQATFTKLPDDSWGITGQGLKEGESVNVMSRSGTGQMMKVGKILKDENGIQHATIAGAPSAGGIATPAGLITTEQFAAMQRQYPGINLQSLQRIKP